MIIRMIEGLDMYVTFFINFLKAKAAFGCPKLAEDSDSCDEVETLSLTCSFRVPVNT